jgi:Xaa-Pro aminopeptidase
MHVLIDNYINAAHHIHQASLRALEAGIRAIKPGLTAGQLDQVIRDELGRAGYQYPIHSGHGLGVSFHEEPRIVPGASLPLEPGMVIALEPGAYTPAAGARVERMLEVTAHGAREMTSYDLSLE